MTSPEALVLARTHSLRAASHVAIIRALETAGHRYAMRAPRSRRGSLLATHPARIHTHNSINPDMYDLLLRGAWDALAEVAPPCLVEAVDTYVRDLLANGIEHHIEYLTGLLAEYGMCDASA